MKLKEPLTGKTSSRNKPFNQILRIFKSKAPNATKFWPPDVVKYPPVGVLLFKLTLYESLEIWPAAPRSNEIRASEEISSLLVAKPFTSFNIFEKFEFSKFRCRLTGCVFYYNFFVSQRRGVRSRQDQAITNWSWSILTDFEIKRFQESRTLENTENVPSAHGHSIQRLTRSRYFSMV